MFGDLVSVMEGDSVTLHADINETYESTIILWTFGAKSSMIAEISRAYGIFTYDVLDGRFRDRLKLNNQTGSLTITNITTQHAGPYEVQISGMTLPSKEFILKKISHSIIVYGELRHLFLSIEHVQVLLK